MSAMSRSGGRRADALRPVTIEPNVLKFPVGAVCITAGDTKLLCTASLVKGVPEFLEESGKGWLTAEYAMLPASTPTRKRREISLGRADSRGLEIKRLIGRALRGAVDLARLDGNTIWLDCDVLQADGGTRTLAITGAWTALALAVRKLRADKRLKQNPLRTQIAAVSAGVVEGRCLLDLDYTEDAAAAVDLNVVMARDGRFIEIQGTAEREPFDSRQLNRMLRLARIGCNRLMRAQRAALKGRPARV